MHTRPLHGLTSASAKPNQPSPDEQVLCEIAKHSFGILLLYVQAGIGVFISLALAYFLLPSVMDDVSSALALANVFAAIVIICAIIIIGLASFTYSQNRLVVTDRSITQTLQNGLFNRKVSQLHLLNVEDVTSEQKGLLATLFGYGVLKIETAGEQTNFHFTYCPRPNYYAGIILSAREKVLAQQAKPFQETLPPVV